MKRTKSKFRSCASCARPRGKCAARVTPAPSSPSSFLVEESMLDDLTEALEHHRRGQLERAASAYEAALALTLSGPMRFTCWVWWLSSKATQGGPAR